uniref:Cellular tumor antigen p53 n=2 Tax=Culex pipiens TaxID=7175 RepID=A0A8D8AUQ6_CULPI
MMDTFPGYLPSSVETFATNSVVDYFQAEKMEIGGQSVDIQVDSQLISPDGTFNLLTYINEFAQEENALLANQAVSFPDGNQTLQVLGENVSYITNCVEMDPTEVLRSNQLPKLEDDKEALYDLSYELCLEELSIPGVEFSVKIAETGRSEMYTQSNQLNKIFTSIEKPCTFELSLNSSPTIQPIVRVMLVCTNMLHQPLSRCAYHTKNDTTEFKNHAVLRRDGSADYVGMPEGKSFRDRLALKIPMGNSARKSITLEFKCLSSCHKIKKVSTALVFTLEDPVGGQLLGREVIPIQISKNFKRDMETAEKAIVKRTTEPSQKRKQPPGSDPGPPSAAPVAGSSNEDPVSVDLNLNLPRSAATDFLKYAEQFFAAKLYGADASTEQELMPCLKKIRRLASGMEPPKDQ